RSHSTVWSRLRANMADSPCRPLRELVRAASNAPYAAAHKVRVQAHTAHPGPGTGASGTDEPGVSGRGGFPRGIRSERLPAASHLLQGAPMRTSIKSASVALVAVALLSAACSDSKDDSGSATGGKTSTTTAN